MDTIEIDAFRVHCLIGVLDREQNEPQPLDVALKLHLDLAAAGDSGALDRTVDYAAVVDHVAALAVHGRFRLLESLALTVCRFLLAPPALGEGRAPIERVEVSLKKPAVLGGRAIPGVRMVREAASARMMSRPWAPGVLMDVLCEAGPNVAYRMHIDLRRHLDVPPHWAISTVAGVLVNDRVTIPANAVLVPGSVSRLVNGGRQTACALVMGSTAPTRTRA